MYNISKMKKEEANLLLFEKPFKSQQLFFMSYTHLSNSNSIYTTVTARSTQGLYVHRKINFGGNSTNAV